MLVHTRAIEPAFSHVCNAQFGADTAPPLIRGTSNMVRLGSAIGDTVRTFSTMLLSVIKQDGPNAAAQVLLLQLPRQHSSCCRKAWRHCISMPFSRRSARSAVPGGG